MIILTERKLIAVERCIFLPFVGTRYLHIFAFHSHMRTIFSDRCHEFSIEINEIFFSFDPAGILSMARNHNAVCEFSLHVPSS